MNVRVYLTAALGVMGLVVGFLAQRSRMCFVAGFRDYLLVRDRELLLGFFSFFVTIWLLTTALYSLDLLKKGAPEYGELRTGETSEIEGGAPKTGADSSGAGSPGERTSSGYCPGEYYPAKRARSGGLVSFGWLAVPRPKAVRLVSAPFAPDRFVIMSLAGGWIIGLLSTFAGGCVLRQHVLAAQGGRDAAWYLVGFYVAVLAYYLLFARFFNSIY